MILCGGNGTRLWPISRKSLPKQFVPLINGKSLLQLTFERVTRLVSDQVVWTVTSEEYRFLVRDVAESANIHCRSILEPKGRNTAAAMAAAALNAKSKQLLLFLPADHYIKDTSAFLKTIYAGISDAENGKIVTYGISPTSPHTGYGYIKTEVTSRKIKDNHLNLKTPGLDSVISFIEKPNEETALTYFNSGGYFWNSGILLVRSDVLIDSLSKYAPDILEVVKQSVTKQKTNDSYIHLNANKYKQCRSESIDYAVLEKCDNVVMAPFLSDWSDIGNWNAVANFTEADSQENRIVGNGIAWQSNNTYIHAPYRPVVALGIKGLFILDTADAVLVMQKNSAENVKELVTSLEKQKMTQAIEHSYATRPWGEYVCIDKGPNFKVKRLTIKPGASISLQLHKHRAEHWVVVKGTARVTKDNETFDLFQNQSTYIPTGSLHRLENPSKIPLEIIEVQSGRYLGEDDIERFDDLYGRK